MPEQYLLIAVSDASRIDIIPHDDFTGSTIREVGRGTLAEIEFALKRESLVIHTVTMPYDELKPHPLGWADPDLDDEDDPEATPVEPVKVDAEKPAP